MTKEERGAETTGYLRLIGRSIEDASFRDLLQSDPDAALKDIGFWVTDPDERELVAKRLSENVRRPIDPPGGEGAHVGILAAVGVAIGTNLSVPEMADPEVCRQAIRARVAKAMEEQKDEA
ncbi:hypothetical protein ACQF36_37795 [Streptomyces sp. Marseille-Q5077]|uniref:hypothetical protein n=1 Tax=Streptomyces sp. Marseille-Q5077 TaxID=3418995 RepID=UPI003CFDEC2D